MGIVKNQSLINTLIGYLGIVIGFINLAYLFPKFFSPENFGLRAILVESSIIFSQITLLGFSGVTNRFFPYFKSKENGNHGFLFIIISIPFLSFLIFSIIFLFFKTNIINLYEDSSPLVPQYYFLILPLTFFWAYLNLLEVYSRVFLKTIASNFIKEILLRLLLTIIIFLYAMGWISINEFWYYFTLTYGVALAILVIYIYYEGNLHLTPNFLFLSKPLFKQMLSFGLFIMFGGAASMVVNKIDTIMISYLTNLKETAVYALALYIATIIETPKRVLNQLTDPLVANAWKDDDINTIHALYQKTSLNQLIVGCLLFMLLWLNIDQIFSIIPKSEIYKEGKFVILFIGLAKLVDMVTGNNGEIIGYSKHYRFGLYSIIFLAGLTILTNYIFIPIYGINGAAFATFLSTSLFNIIKFTFLKFKFNLQPFTTRTLKVLIISTTTYLIVAHIPETEIIIFDLLINSTLIFFLFLVPIIYLRISPDITEMVEQKLKFLNFKKK